MTQQTNDNLVRPSIHTLQGTWIMWDDKTQTNTITFTGNRYEQKYTFKKWYHNPFGFLTGDDVAGNWYAVGNKLHLKKKKIDGNLIDQLGPIGGIVNLPFNLIIQFSEAIMPADPRIIVRMTKDWILFKDGVKWKKLSPLTK